MRRSVLVSIAFFLVMFARSTPAAAQSTEDCDQARVAFLCPPKHYTTEIGLHLGVWTLMESGGEFGGHVTRNRNEWFAMEYGLSYRSGANVRKPSGLANASVRIGVRDPSRNSRNLAMAFLTVGVAAGNSANFSVSPMVGVGLQVGQLDYRGRESPVKLRVEIQILTRGRPTDDRGRLLIGMAATFGRKR